MAGKWQKGQSGNPKGRKPNSRTLTEILRVTGNRKRALQDGRKIVNARLVAQLGADSSGVSK
jgi:hypothetical protein